MARTARTPKLKLFPHTFALKVTVRGKVSTVYHTVEMPQLTGQRLCAITDDQVIIDRSEYGDLLYLKANQIYNAANALKGAPVQNAVLGREVRKKRRAKRVAKLLNVAREVRVKKARKSK